MSTVPPPPLPTEQSHGELRQVLKWLRKAAEVVTVAYAAAAVIFFIEGLRSGTRFGVALGIGSLVALCLGGLLNYLWSLAAIGFIEVVLDVERNTRGRD